MVVVTVNDRLGLPGLRYGDGVPANLALRDQIAALRWVRQNVAAFGGDPGRVTLAGHSAGSTCVPALMTCAPGLFARAAAMSPAPYGLLTPGRARAWTAAAVAALGGRNPAQVPLLVATTAEETRLFTAIGHDGPDTQEIAGGPADEIVAAHHAPARHLVCRHRSPGWSALWPHADPQCSHRPGSGALMVRHENLGALRLSRPSS
ncbi:carboxylesterase family protein [Nonomuraea sp. FMUSA5-5]|uniref:Carboxylic ester hydrolase n=1 Tax=Nonomuraea composti TaxID=2720023 RepID=A0ABX1BL30_9ACTN|nr:carboxylesterase family protein [Nonomuraea sp. FMUSA5-5]